MIARYTFAFLSAALFVCVLAQVFIAGLAIFDSPLNWARHTAFVHIFEFLPLLMLLAGWLGKAPRRLLWRSAALFGLIYLQYFTANIRAVSGVAAATHPVVALLIAAASYTTMTAAYRQLKTG